MAEPCLKMAVQTGLPVFLFQACKTKNQLDTMEIPDGVITCLRYANQDVLHAKILDDLFIQRDFDPVLSFDHVILLDHDCLTDQEHFNFCVHETDSRLSSGSILVARGWHQRGIHYRDFSTVPFFAISTHYRWNRSWHFVRYDTPQAVFYDTGQILSQSLIQSGQSQLMDLTAQSFIDSKRWHHWGSAWSWMEHQEREEKDVERYRQNYLELAKTNIWSMNEYDAEIASRYKCLDYAARYMFK